MRGSTFWKRGFMEGSRLHALLASRIPSTACLLCPSPWPGTGAPETDTLNCRKASSQQAASRMHLRVFCFPHTCSKVPSTAPHLREPW